MRQLSQHLFEMGFQLDLRSPTAVVGIFPFQPAPQAFNRVEVRRISRQKDDLQPCLLALKPLCQPAGVMEFSVVTNQKEFIMAHFSLEMAKKTPKTHGVDIELRQNPMKNAGCFACPTTHENQFSPDPNSFSLGDTTAANCYYYAHKEADLRANAYPGADAL
jgi:hypothetical protein